LYGIIGHSKIRIIKEMIIVQLLGGLGNQMFQYAIARSLSNLRGIDFRIDISAFDKYKLHKYSLHNFNISEKIANENELELFNASILKKLYKNLFEWCKPYYKKYIIIEKYDFKYDKNIFKIPENSYLRGYWQNENYFINIKRIIYDEFTIKNPLEGKNLEYSEIIRKENSVSMHFRRGDYVEDKTTNSVHGTCSIDYYKKSVQLMANKLSNPHFFVFSDDIEWVKKNFIINYPVYYIDHNDANKNYEDLRLMSLCKNNVIANSSFSWWGAWLNQTENKIVISPSRWLNDPRKSSTKHIPQNWIKI